MIPKGYKGNNNVDFNYILILSYFPILNINYVLEHFSVTDYTSCLKDDFKKRIDITAMDTIIKANEYQGKLLLAFHLV